MSVVCTQRNKLVLLNRKPKDFPPINRSPEKNTLRNANKPIQLWLSLENYVNIGTWLLTSQCKWLPIDNKLVQPLVNRLHRNLTPSFSPPQGQHSPRASLETVAMVTGSLQTGCVCYCKVTIQVNCHSTFLEGKVCQHRKQFPEAMHVCPSQLHIIMKIKLPYYTFNIKPCQPFPRPPPTDFI